MVYAHRTKRSNLMYRSSLIFCYVGWYGVFRLIAYRYIGNTLFAFYSCGRDIWVMSCQWLAKSAGGWQKICSHGLMLNLFCYKKAICKHNFQKLAKVSKTDKKLNQMHVTAITITQLVLLLCLELLITALSKWRIQLSIRLLSIIYVKVI